MKITKLNRKHIQRMDLRIYNAKKRAIHYNERWYVSFARPLIYNDIGRRGLEHLNYWCFDPTGRMYLGFIKGQGQFYAGHWQPDDL